MDLVLETSVRLPRYYAVFLSISPSAVTIRPRFSVCSNNWPNLWPTTVCRTVRRTQSSFCRMYNGVMWAHLRARLFFGMAGPYAAVASHPQFQPLLKWALSHCAVFQSIRELRFPTLCRTFCKLSYSLLNLLSSCNSHICREEMSITFTLHTQSSLPIFNNFR